MTAQEYKAPESITRLEKNALVVGVLGLVGSIIGLIIDRGHFFQSYLMAFLLVLGLSLGSLGLLMLQHLTGGDWGIMIRRPLEAATRVLWLVPVLFVPVIYGMKYLYTTHTVDGETRDLDGALVCPPRLGGFAPYVSTANKFDWSVLT